MQVPTAEHPEASDLRTGYAALLVGLQPKGLVGTFLPREPGGYSKSRRLRSAQRRDDGMDDGDTGLWELNSGEEGRVLDQAGKLLGIGGILGLELKRKTWATGQLACWQFLHSNMVWHGAAVVKNTPHCMGWHGTAAQHSTAPRSSTILTVMGRSEKTDLWRGWRPGVVWCGVVWCAKGAVTKWQWPGCLAYRVMQNGRAVCPSTCCVWYVTHL